MTDVEYLFRQTERDRKRDGRGAYNKKGGSKSKKCSLPSDKMTQKEWKKMNGPVVSYNMNKPVSWKEFKLWPDDIQREYLQLLMEKYSVGTPELSKMFGVSDKQMQDRRKKIGLAAKRGGKRPPILPEWWVFLGEAKPVEILPEKVSEETEIPSEKVEPPADEAEILRLAALLSALKGTGAKVTIEVTL
jgi:hypothetical protein